MPQRRQALRWVAFGSPGYDAVVELRREVLRRPLGLDFSAQDLVAEARDRHLALWIGGRVAGCLLLRDKGRGVVQMRQVAVSARCRGRGLGRALVAKAEADCAKKGVKRIILHARQDAVGFYRHLGYCALGKPFIEIGLKHRLMAKDIVRKTKKAPKRS